MSRPRTASAWFAWSGAVAVVAALVAWAALPEGGRAQERAAPLEAEPAEAAQAAPARSPGRGRTSRRSGRGAARAGRARTAEEPAAPLAQVAPAAKAAPAAPGQGPARRVVTWRALSALDDAAVELPNAVNAYRALLKSGALFNRNPFAKHAPPRDRLDLYVTRLADVRKRSFDLRRTLYLPPPAKVTYRVTVPAGGRLAFGHARHGLQASVQVTVDDAPVWQGAPQLRWQDVDLDLAKFAGREVALTFASQGRGHVFLSDPRVVAGDTSGKPNVLVIMVDTMAAWSLGCYGQKMPVSPRMDRLCKEGVRFDNAIAQANWTRPSVTSMLSSWQPGKIGISYNQFFGLDIAPERTRFYQQQPALAPLALSQAGYTTGALVNNLFLQGYHRYGVDMGFDQVVDYRTHVEDTVDITDDAIRFLRQNKDNRFFLFLNYNAPHVHYVPPSQYAQEVRRMNPRLGEKTSAYLGEVRYSDAEVGRLLTALDRLGLRDDTLVVLTADHGEVHDPRHGYRVQKTGRSSLYGHAVTMYDEELRVPLVLRWPGKLPAGTSVKAQVRHLDFTPSMFEAAGLPPSPKHQGQSFLGLARGEAEAAERVSFSEGRMMRAVRAGGYKFVWRLPGYERIARGGRSDHVPEELYDLTADPREYRNLAGVPAQAERLARLRALGREYAENLAVPGVVAPATRTAAQTPAGQLKDSIAASASSGANGANAASGSSAAGSAGALVAPVPAAAAKARSAPRPMRFHLLVVGDGTPRHFEGRVRIRGGIRHFRLSEHEAMDAVWREKDGSVRFRLDVKDDRDALWLEPASANSEDALELELTMDGKKDVPLRVGPYGLPLVEGGRIAGAELALLDAREAPPVRPGHELGAFLWREPGSGGIAAAGSGRAGASAAGSAALPRAASGSAADEESSAAEADERPAGGGDANKEVEGMLRDWGYIQEGAKKKASGAR